MKDMFDNDVFIGDKLIFIPPKYSGKHEVYLSNILHYGMVIKLTKDNKGCYIKSLNSNWDEPILRYQYQIYKISS